MPSVPTYPAGRQSAQRPAARREYEAFDSVETAFTSVPAGTTPSLVASFSGLIERVVVQVNAGTHAYQLREYPEKPARQWIVLGTAPYEFKGIGRYLFAFDTSGAGGGALSVVGYHPVRDIDVRDNRPGPIRERPALTPGELAHQVHTPE